MSERLAELIRERQPVVVLTGAGVSNETSTMYRTFVDDGVRTARGGTSRSTSEA